MEIVCQPLTLYPSPHDMEMYSLHEREEDFFKRGLAPLKLPLLLIQGKESQREAKPLFATNFPLSLIRRGGLRG